MFPDGLQAFPTDFVKGGIGPVHTVQLPEAELAVRHLAGGGCLVESHFGFRLNVRNETEGAFVVYAHCRGNRTLDLPEEMIHLFRAVKGYEAYLRTVWGDLYRAYGRECGDRAAAYSHTRAAFQTLGLPVPAEEPPPSRVEKNEQDRHKPKRKRGARTPETAYYLPILQALQEMGGSGRAADVVRRVGEILADSLLPEDRKPLPSSGILRWDNTSRFARHSMVRNGLLKSKSPWGVWQISSKGREHLRRFQTG